MSHGIATAWIITGARFDKVGWIKPHNCHKRLIKYQKPSTLIIGDSIGKDLRRYIDVWYRHFGKIPLTLTSEEKKLKE